MNTAHRFMMATLALCLLTLLSTSAKADPLTLTLTFPHQTGTVGNILTFGGSVTMPLRPRPIVSTKSPSMREGNVVFDDSPFVPLLLQTSSRRNSGLLAGPPSNSGKSDART